MIRRSHGVNVMELMVAIGVLGLLGLLTVVLFRAGASGWKKMEAQSGLHADYQVFNEKITREVHRSVFASASTATHQEGTTLAFLSALDDSGTFVIDPASLEPRWQKYLIFYWDKTSRQIFMSELKLSPGAAESKAPEPLEDYDDGTGKLNDYRIGGRLLMTDVDNCLFETAHGMLTVKVTASKLRYGDDAPETLDTSHSIAFRN